VIERAWPAARAWIPGWDSAQRAARVPAAVQAEDAEEPPGVTSCFLGALRDEAERAALGDDLADVGACDWGEGKVEGGERSGGLAADGDAAGISPEGSDVAPHPGQGGGLILGAEVLDAEVREVEVAERAQAVVGG